MARPPETTMRAAVSSGRSDFTTSAPTKELRPGSGAAATASMGALPPVAATGSKEAARTVITFFSSAVFTVASALPA
jgi:hypothetical protein